MKQGFAQNTEWVVQLGGEFGRVDSVEDEGSPKAKLAVGSFLPSYQLVRKPSYYSSWFCRD